jgi:hypothetical protein
MFSYWSNILGCCTVWLDNCFPTFRRNTPPSYSGLCVCELSHNPEDEGNVRNKGATTLKTHFFNNFAMHSSNHCLVLLKIYLFLSTLSFSFILFCWCTNGLRKNEKKSFHNIWKSISMNISKYLFFLKKKCRKIGRLSSIKYWYLRILITGLYSQHDVLNEKFTSFTRRAEFLFKWPKYIR